MPTAPTPADARLLAFLASARTSEGDALRDPRRARVWCEAHALDPGRRPLDADDLARLRTLRSGFRGAIDAPAGAAARRLAGLAARARLTVVAGPDGPRIGTSAVGVDAVIGRLLIDAADATERGAWTRIRICAAPGCDQVFLDTTRSRTRMWCDMATCGNRAKVRAHRARTRNEEDT